MSIPSDPRASSGAARDELDALTREACAGDKAALARLHARLTPGLTAHFARRLRADAATSDEADELAQRAWIACWEALQAGKYDPGKARLSTFLYAVAQVVWMRSQRERGRSKGEGLETGDAAPAAGALPADACQLAALVQLVRQVVQGEAGGLSDTDRATLRAVAEDLTNRELASRLGVSASTAHARRLTALESLRAFLASKGIFGHERGGDRNPRTEDAGRARGEAGAKKR